MKIFLIIGDIFLLVIFAAGIIEYSIGKDNLSAIYFCCMSILIKISLMDCRKTFLDKE